MEDKKQDNITHESRYDSPDYWFRWIRAAEKAAKQHREDACRAWSEYENQNGKLLATGNDKPSDRLYPIYFTSCKTLESAYYSRTPKLVVEKAFDIDDVVANTMSYIHLHFAKYLVKNSNFDAVMHAAVQDFIHAGKTTTQIIYESEDEESEERTDLTQQDEETYLDQNGNPVDGEVLKDDKGYFSLTKKLIPTNQKIYLSPVCYDEVIHTPEAKMPCDIKAIGYKFCLTQEEAEERFKKQDGTLPLITWKEGRSPESEGGEIKDNQPLGKYIEGYEIYNECNKKVYWISEQVKNEFLDVQEDPYGFKDFFPSPAFIIDSKPSKSLYPTPIYIQLYPTLKQLHEIYSKIFNLIQAIRRRAIVDGATPELIQALNDLSDNEFIAATNLNNIVEKGGLQNMIFYVPVQELVTAIGELQNLEETFKNLVYEWFGVPDIIRGVGDPIETAAAQEIKKNAAHDRFRFAKKQIAQLARNSIEMMLDLGYKVYDDAKVASICGIQYKPEHQPYFAQALASLRSDEERIIRINVETDSLSYTDDFIKQQENLQIAQTVNNGLKEIAAISAQNPEFVPTAVKSLLLVVESMNGGSEFSNGIREAVSQLFNKINQPNDAPPPPDYEMMNVQLEARKVALQEQQFGFEQNKFAVETANMQVKNDIELEKLKLENKKQDLEHQIKALNTQLKAMESATTADTKKSEQELKAIKEKFSQDLQASYLELDKVTSMLKIKEQFMEEARLRQQNLEAQVKEISGQLTKPRETSIQVPQHQPPVIHIHNGGSKEISMKREPDGSIRGIAKHVPEEVSA